MSDARIVVIGNEVLSGEVEDRNIHFLARRLTDLGTRLSGVAVVPDEDDAIIEALRGALHLDRRVLVSGGIGPTHDDRTRGAVARALDLPLVLNVEAEARLRAGYGTRLTSADLEMALLPEGARVVAGRSTGVIGFVVGRVYCFPGVPDLLADIFETVADEFTGTPDHRLEIVTRQAEGSFAAELAQVSARYPDVLIGSYPTRDPRGWHVRLVLKGADRARVEEAAGHVRRVTIADR